VGRVVVEMMGRVHLLEVRRCVPESNALLPILDASGRKRVVSSGRRRPHTHEGQRGVRREQVSHHPREESLC
jgi:hypothetical protein